MSEPPTTTTPLERRAELLGQQGCVLWFTGLSGAGKTTLARALERALLDDGRLPFVLDADVVRTGLNVDLGYDAASRSENVRRLGELAKILADAGSIVLVASIAPFAADRARFRERIGPERFLEIHVATSLEVCQGRDVKGLYARSASGELKGMTGIDSPYEAPQAPDLTLDTARTPLTEGVALLLEAGARVWTR
jgi:adenylyl-sulfate kinase